MASSTSLATMTTTATTTGGADDNHEDGCLFQPRLSSQDLEALLTSAYSTHERYRSGKLVVVSNEASSQSSETSSKATTSTLSYTTHASSSSSSCTLATTSADTTTTTLQQQQQQPLHQQQQERQQQPLQQTVLTSDEANESVLPSLSTQQRSFLSNHHQQTTAQQQQQPQNDQNDKKNPWSFSVPFQKLVWRTVQSHRTTVLRGPNGCGKSTEIPLLLLLMSSSSSSSSTHQQQPQPQQNHYHHQQQHYHNDGTSLPSTTSSTTAVWCAAPHRLAAYSQYQRVVSTFRSVLDQHNIAVDCCLHTAAATTRRRRPHPDPTQHELVFTTRKILWKMLLASSSSTVLQRCIVVLDDCHETTGWNETRLIRCWLRRHWWNQPQSFCRFVLMSATPPRNDISTSTSTTTRSTAPPPRLLHNNNDNPVLTFLPQEEEEQEQDNNKDDHVQPRQQQLTQSSSLSSSPVYYIRDIVHRLEQQDATNNHNDDDDDNATHRDYGRFMRINPDADLDPKQQQQQQQHHEHEHEHDGPLSKPLLSMIQSLLIDLHKTELTENNFLVFGPNRASLEQIQQQLLQQKQNMDLEMILLDDRSMQGDLKTLYDDVCRDWTTTTTNSPSTEGDPPRGVRRRRRVWLATPLFQSGVYFARVKCVVDLCRSSTAVVVEPQPEDDTSSSNNNNNNNNNDETVVWASQAACDQRQGRAMKDGGQTFRLVDRGFYLSRFPKDEPPHQPPPQKNNHRCRNELLRLLYSPTVKDPRGLLHEALWDSSGGNIHEAVTHLRQIKAIERAGPASYDSLRLTQYGKLLAALPLDDCDDDDDMADARTVVRGAQLGLLHETVAFVAAQRHPPLGSIADWYQNPCNDKMQFFANTSPALAQLAAYMFWESEWRYAEQRRHQNLSVFFHETSHGQESTAFRWTPETEKLHEDWCKLHAINPSAVLLIANVVDETIRTLFSSSFEPDWLRCTDPQPRWVRQRRRGTGSDQRQDMLTRVYGLEAAVVGDALVALAEDQDEIPLPFLTNDEEVACVHFLMGYCKYGTLCRNSHSRNAIRPPCRFHLAGFCTKGDQCPYSHEVAEQKRVAGRCSDPMLSLVPVMKQLFVQGGPLGWYQRNYPHILLLGEGHFTFTSSLEYLGYPPYLATSNIFDSTFLEIPNRWKGVDATRLHLDQRVLQQTSIGKVQSFAWNFPSFGVDNNDCANENLLLECFHSIALVRSMIPFLRPVMFQFAVVLHSDQFSRWNLLRSANLTGWRLTGWAPFNASVFPGYFPSKLNGEAISCDSARFYVFSLPIERTMLRP